MVWNDLWTSHLGAGGETVTSIGRMGGGEAWIEVPAAVNINDFSPALRIATNQEVLFFFDADIGGRAGSTAFLGIWFLMGAAEGTLAAINSAVLIQTLLAPGSGTFFKSKVSGRIQIVASANASDLGRLLVKIPRK